MRLEEITEKTEDNSVLPGRARLAHPATAPGLWVKSILDGCKRPLGSLWGASWKQLCSLLGPLGDRLGASWGLFWASWGHLVVCWEPLGGMQGISGVL